MPDMSLVGFMTHMAGAAVRMEEQQRRGLEAASVLIEDAAKEAIGEYQAGAGPFAAWAELADATKADRVRQGFPANEPELRTGELRESIQHRVEGTEAVVGSDAEVMVFQELGTSKMPPRSILGGAAFRNAEHAAQLIGGHMHAALIGGGALVTIK